MSVLIRQAKIADPQSEFHHQVADIFIENGIIKTISTGSDAKADKIIEGKDCWVSPGFVDVLADYREPGLEHKETIESGLRCAIAGGFTTVMLAPNTQPGITNKSAVQYIQKKAEGSLVKLLPLGAVTQDIEGKSLAEMHDMHTHGAVAFSDGWKPVQHAGLMLKALEYVKAFDGTLIQMPIDTALTAGGLMHEGVTSTRLGMAGIPELAETILLHRDIELLRYTGSKLHITGISTAAGVTMIRNAKAEGLQITCSVTPYHLALNDEALAGYDSIYKVMPVLRSEADRLALIAGLKDGAIDCIASHHRPQEWDSKTKEFEYAGDGMNVQELAFSIVYDAVKEEVSMDRLIDAFAVRPRTIFGLPVASLKEGANAELTIFNTGIQQQLDINAVQSRSRNNPFIGSALQGKIMGVINHEKASL